MSARCRQALLWRGPQAGASRFEFAVVTVVAGVLMTLALREVGPWQQSIRELRLAQAQAAVQAAVNLHHLRCVQSSTRPCRITLQNGQEVADIHGYPAASANGIVQAVDPQGLGMQWRQDQRNGLPVVTFFIPAPSGAACEFTYVQASTEGAQPGIDHQRVSCP